MKAFVCCVLMLLAILSIARADGNGVLFYAGFENSVNAVSAGDGKGTVPKGIPVISAGKRGNALVISELNGLISYNTDGNILPDRGSIEFWFKATDWNGEDSKSVMFFNLLKTGRISIYKDGAAKRGAFVTDGETLHWCKPTAKQDFSSIKSGEWHHIVATWCDKALYLYLDGKPSKRISDPSIISDMPTEFIIGGDCLDGKPSAGTNIDELYIYDRPLSAAEVQWAYQNTANRAAGQDLPVSVLERVHAYTFPHPTVNKLHVDVQVSGVDKFKGTVRLMPAAGTKPATIKLTGNGKGMAVISYKSLPAGDYKVVAEAKDSKGNLIGKAEDKFVSPGPAVWKGNKIGVPTTPPVPWTPIEFKEGAKDQPSTFKCWGRTYVLGTNGLPSKLDTLGRDILAAPIALNVVTGGRNVTWKTVKSKVEYSNEVAVKMVGVSESEIGKLHWTATAEFDGMIRYDLALHPKKGATVDSLDMRLSLNPKYATLDFMQHGPYPWGEMTCGTIPAGNGVVFKSQWARYCWLGDEDCGIAGFLESDEPWDRIDRADGFKLERSQKSVDAVWSFIGSPKQLDKPWKLTFGIQATPVKSVEGARKWMLTGNGPVKGINNVEVPWPSPDTQRYFGFPEATNAEEYKKHLKEFRDRGSKVVPYSLISSVSFDSPEGAFYGYDWKTWYIFRGTGDVEAYEGYLLACSPTNDWNDFITWKSDQYVRDYDLDGLYHDLTYVTPTVNEWAGYGSYVRDGKVRPIYPIFGVRETYKRIYCMLKDYGKEKGKDMYMVSHMSPWVFIPILSFSDSYLDGEQFQFRIKDNYLELLDLGVLRAELMGHNLGVTSIFLPEYLPEYCTSPEPTQHLAGLALLHDFTPWIAYCNHKEMSRIYQTAIDFGIVDAKFIPYWRNADIIGGQTDTLKCSAYRRPAGGSLVVVYNLTKDAKKADLTVDWEKLKTPGSTLSVVDALSGEPIPVDGKNLSVEVKSLNFRFIQVK